MNVRLRVLKGKLADSEVVISQHIFRIGRHEDNHLRPASQAISRYHCQIEVGETEVVVRDMQSRNGTFVNGRRITQCSLESGDVLRLGLLEFRVLIGDGGDNDSRSDASEDCVARAMIEDDTSRLILEHPDERKVTEGTHRRIVRIANAASWSAELPHLLGLLEEYHVHYPLTDAECRSELQNPESKTWSLLREQFNIAVVFDCDDGKKNGEDFELDHFLQYHVRDQIAFALGFEFDDAYNQEQISQMLQDAGNQTCLFCFLNADALSESDQQHLREFTQSCHRVLFCGPNEYIAARSDTPDRKKQPGKLPQRPSDMSADSREAANEMLKKFFNNR